MTWARAVCWLGLAACTPPAVQPLERAAVPSAFGAPRTEGVRARDPAGVPSGSRRLGMNPEERALRETLERVAVERELPVRRPVTAEVVSRERARELLVEKTLRDSPKELLQAQGEFLAALELIPPDYSFVEGLFAMLAENVAGFYDPKFDTLYLLNDLDEGASASTLSHELIHALQAQHFDLRDRLTYRPGELDVLAATSTLAEGDAFAAMFTASTGPREPLSAEQAGESLLAAVASTPSGASSPPALLRSLVAPYRDGYRFVSALHARGGWAEVNRVWREPPGSTEQVLHLAKYDAHEPPLSVAAPTAGALGPGWRTLDSDVMGEQAMRTFFEQDSRPEDAARAAAGWGGDRYTVFARDAVGGRELAVAVRIRFDDVSEAVEAEAFLRSRYPACRERPRLGPVAVARLGADLALVAGPFLRQTTGTATPLPLFDCANARSWLVEVLGAP